MVVNAGVETDLVPSERKMKVNAAWNAYMTKAHNVVLPGETPFTGSILSKK